VRAPVSGNADAPILLTPASSEADLSQGFAPAGGGAKGFAPAVLRTGLASYAPDRDLSGAAVAADRLAAAGAAKAKADKVAAGAPVAGARVVQLGAFADPANARRVADSFRRYGRVEIADLSVGGRAIHSVRVILEDARIGTAVVISAAAASGLNGARVTAD
jgi:hypothetical protein